MTTTTSPTWRSAPGWGALESSLDRAFKALTMRLWLLAAVGFLAILPEADHPVRGAVGVLLAGAAPVVVGLVALALFRAARAEVALEARGLMVLGRAAAALACGGELVLFGQVMGAVTLSAPVSIAIALGAAALLLVSAGALVALLARLAPRARADHLRGSLDVSLAALAVLLALVFAIALGEPLGVSLALLVFCVVLCAVLALLPIHRFAAWIRHGGVPPRVIDDVPMDVPHQAVRPLPHLGPLDAEPAVSAGRAGDNLGGWEAARDGLRAVTLALGLRLVFGVVAMLLLSVAFHGVAGRLVSLTMFASLIWTDAMAGASLLKLRDLPPGTRGRGWGSWAAALALLLLLVDGALVLVLAGISVIEADLFPALDGLLAASHGVVLAATAAMALSLARLGDAVGRPAHGGRGYFAAALFVLLTALALAVHALRHSPAGDERSLGMTLGIGVVVLLVTAGFLALRLASDTAEAIDDGVDARRRAAQAG